MDLSIATKLTLAITLGMTGCPADDSGGDEGPSDATQPAEESGSATNGMTASATGPTTTATTDPASSDGPAATCELTNIVASPGLEGCFECMTAMCCAELQLCDQTQRCLDCLADPTNLDACVDPVTFVSYPEYAGFATCQTDLCVPPCGVDGGSSCTPGDCAPTCPNAGSGCA